MAEWGCGEYTECPCGCGWAVCSVFGEWIEPSDCSDCDYRDDDEEGEDDAGSGN